MKHLLRSLVDEYCEAYDVRRIGEFACVRRGPDIRLSQGDVRVVGRLSAPLSLVGTFVARCNRVELAGRPLVLTTGVSFVIRTRRLLYRAAEILSDAGEVEEADLLLYLAFGEALLHEDDEDDEDGDALELRADLVARGKKRPALTESLNGTHASALKKVTAWTRKPKGIDRVRGLYAMTTVLEDAAYANELKLEALVGAALLSAGQSKSAAEREAAWAAMSALAVKLLLGSAYREIVPYATALVDAGFDTPAALALRFVGFAATLDTRAEDDAAILMKYARQRGRVGWFKAPGSIEAYVLHLRIRAARALMLNARGRDPCLRRLKAEVAKPSPAQRAKLVAAARVQLREAESLVAGGAAATDELKLARAELAKAF